jgi:hypothetical protein
MTQKLQIGVGTSTHGTQQAAGGKVDFQNSGSTYTTWHELHFIVKLSEPNRFCLRTNAVQGAGFGKIVITNPNYTPRALQLAWAFTPWKTQARVSP